MCERERGEIETCELQKFKRTFCTLKGWTCASQGTNESRMLHTKGHTTLGRYRGRLTNSEHTYTLGKCTHSHTRAIDLCKGSPCRGISQVATCTGGPKARMSSLPAGEPTQRSSCFLLASVAQKTRHNNHCLTAYQAQRHSFYGGSFARWGRTCFRRYVILT